MPRKKKTEEAPPANTIKGLFHRKLEDASNDEDGFLFLHFSGGYCLKVKTNMFSIEETKGKKEVKSETKRV